jgi:DNA polymerase-3 subunit delta'
MCLGAASAANAFLKTLEEPPAHTLILLTSARPAMLLPTVVSRCLRLDLGFEDIDGLSAREPEWIARWRGPQPNPALRAYARAQILHEHWAEIREAAEAHLRDAGEMEEDTAAALLEAEFQLGRQESVAQLQRWYWRRAEAAAGTPEPERMRAVRSLEDLQAALAQNVEPNLAVEVACLRIEGLV